MIDLKSLAKSWLPPLLQPSAWFSSYESANPSPRRGSVPGAAPTDAKRELSRGIRSELVRKSRYLHKNSGFVRELVGNMAMYSTGDGIRVQAMSDSPEWNRAAEEHFRNWSASCEITRRFSFEECQAMICRGIDIDGEYFVHKTRDAMGNPRLQLIETHRIGDTSWADNRSVDGVVLDAYGAPIAYRVIQDDNTTRELPADSVLHIHEPEWAGGVRNAPGIQHSINHILDEIEILALEKYAVKDNSDVSRVLKRENGTIDDNGDFTVATDTDSEKSDPVALQKIMGGKLVALNIGESLESYQSNRPSPAFTGFLEHLRRDAALGVLPFEFAADSSKVGGAGVRLIVAKADRRFSYRQMILERRLIKPVWNYIIADAIARGMLPAVDGWWKITTVPPRRITVDAGREAQQNRADVEMGLKTISDHYNEMGADFGEEIERRGADAKLILETAEKYGVPVDMLWKVSGGPSAPVEDPVEERTPNTSPPPNR